MKVENLIFVRHLWYPPLVQSTRAVVRFDNGYKVSIIQGQGIFYNWRPGLYEAAIMTDDLGLVYETALTEDIVRGNAEFLQKFLDDVEALPVLPKLEDIFKDASNSSDQ